MQNLLEKGDCLMGYEWLSWIKTESFSFLNYIFLLETALQSCLQRLLFWSFQKNSLKAFAVDSSSSSSWETFISTEIAETELYDIRFRRSFQSVFCLVLLRTTWSTFSVSLAFIFLNLCRMIVTLAFNTF